MKRLKILLAILTGAMIGTMTSAIANDYFNASGVPATGAVLSSATIRGEFSSVAAGFDKLPTLTGNGNKVVTVNAGGTALTATTASALSGMTIGTNIQAWDADLDALAALAATAGMVSRTGAGAFAVRTITGTANEISVSDGGGASANPTLSLPSALTFTGKTMTGGTFSSPALTGTPTAPTASSGTNTTQIATTAFVQAATTATVPVGAMFDYAGTSAPSGYLLCNGAAVSRTTYAGLFAAIGTTWGAGDGSTTFNVPDFRRRVAVGSGGTGTATLGNAVGNIGGAETHTLTTSEIPSHTHTGTTASAGAHTHTYDKATSATAGFQSGTAFTTTTPTATSSDGVHTHTFTSDATGGGAAHNNMQPSAVVLKIIKL